MQGHGLCALQDAAVYYCEVEEVAEQRFRDELQLERDRNQFKYALLISGQMKFADLFPELIQQATDEDDFDPDEDNVVYLFNDQPGKSPEELARELASLMSGGLTVKGGDLIGPSQQQQLQNTDAGRGPRPRGID